MKTSSVVEEWRAEGREEGRIEERQGKLKRVLTKRFGTPPVEVISAIDSTDDAVLLDRWFDFSLDADRLADMRQRMEI